MEVSRDIAEKILEVDDLKINFNNYNGSVQPVMSRPLMRLLTKNARDEKGSITFKSEEISCKTEAQMTKIRGSEIAMIFQDAITSFDPTMKVREQIAAPLIKHQQYSKK